MTQMNGYSPKTPTQKQLAGWLFAIGAMLVILPITFFIPTIGHPHVYENRAFSLVCGTVGALIMASGIGLRMAA